MIPGINDDHADLLDVQKKNRNWKGWVAPLPNCTTTGLAITLKPLYEKYGVKKVIMTSMQAISGGGRSPGVSAMQINDNIVPYIAKEEGKVRVETRKMLGKIDGPVIKDADIKVSSTCTRVPVIGWHIQTVSLCTNSTLYEIDPAKAEDLYTKENKDISVAGLPSAPEHYYAVSTRTLPSSFAMYGTMLSFICIAETPGDLPPPDIACIEVIITFFTPYFS